MDFKINEIEYNKLPKLMQELVDHYEISETLLGFLMILNKAELDELAASLDNPVDLLGTFPLLAYYKGIPDEGTVMTTDQLTESVSSCMSDVAMVGMHKKGLLQLIPSENGKDEDWIVRTTDKGKELAIHLFGEKEDKETKEE